MPDKEGIETIIGIKKQSPEMPVIEMSGGRLNPADGYLRVARFMGSIEIINKPI